jgi:hypothetical protein
MEMPEYEDPYTIQPGTMCANCGKRPATNNWVGEGTTLDLIHGNYVQWCEPCCAKASLEYARKQADRIPELEDWVKRLEEDNG